MFKFLLLSLLIVGCSVKTLKRDEGLGANKDLPPGTVEISDSPEKKTPGIPIGKTFEKPLPKGRTHFRVGSWNIMSKTQKVLKEPHGFTGSNGSLPAGTKAMVPLAVMKKFNINIMCLQEIYLKMNRDGSTPSNDDLKGSVYLEAKKQHPMYKDISITTEEEVFVKGKGTTNEQRETISFLYQDTKNVKVKCDPAGKVPMTLAGDRDMAVASCTVSEKPPKKEKIKFLVYCAHFYNPNEAESLKETISRLDDHTEISPLKYNKANPKKGEINGKAILMGDLNSYYKQQGQKQTWAKVKNWSFKPIRFNKGNESTKLTSNNGKVYSSMKIYDDIIPTNEMVVHYEIGTKMPLPIQIYPMKSGSISRTANEDQWLIFKQFADHIPIKADYCIKECKKRTL